MSNVNQLYTIKMDLKCHKSSDALYLLTLLTNSIVEANRVYPDQQQSIMCLHCLTNRILNISEDGKTIYRFKDKIN